MAIKLSKADMEAITTKDSGYINEKGAVLYKDGKYEDAIEYYRIAAAMGNRMAISNLGYCYMYRRSVEKNMSLAMAYFKIAADRGVVDANYKLGDIYEKGNGEIKKNKELSTYYYQRAAKIIFSDNLNPQDYPSLFFALARELMPKGKLYTDFSKAYYFLRIAEEGYSEQIINGANFYEESLNNVRELLANPIFRQFALNDDTDPEDYLPN
ncbi:MAG: tetratricopeptide repeat protein [Oscillospiraceae bacterium]|nr:tetratricopeptide repeat protein [Oscillospiraceae bacterium]